MRTVAICSPASEAVATGQIRSYLETNCPWLEIDVCSFIDGPAGTLEAVERALSFDVALLLLSPDSIPNPWRRDLWEPILIQEARRSDTSVAHALIRPCKFPEIFRKQIFFDLCELVRAPGLRRLRAWFVAHAPNKYEPSELPVAEAGMETSNPLADSVLDRPGCAFDIPRSVVFAFAEAHRDQFEGVFCIDCFRRHPAAISGDLARDLRLRLRGDAKQNTAALREYCSNRRFLLIFDGLSPAVSEPFVFGGASSTVFTIAGAARQEACAEPELLKLFANWRSHTERCLQLLPAAERFFAGSRNSNAKRIGSQMVELLKEQECFAEAYELIETLLQLAWEEGNKPALETWTWEKSWIQDAWGLTKTPSLRLGVSGEPIQLGLGF